MKKMTTCVVVALAMLSAALATTEASANAQRAETQRETGHTQAAQLRVDSRPIDDNGTTSVVVDTWVPDFIDIRAGDDEGPNDDPDAGMPWQNVGGTGGGSWGPPSIPSSSPNPPSSNPSAPLPQIAQDALVASGLPGLAGRSWFSHDGVTDPPPWSGGHQQLLNNQGIGFLELIEGWQPVADTGHPDVEAWALFEELDQERTVVVWFDNRCECGPNVSVSVEREFTMGSLTPGPFSGQQIQTRFTQNFGPGVAEMPDGSSMEVGDGYFEDSRWPGEFFLITEQQLFDAETFGLDFIDVLTDGNIHLNIYLFLNGLEYYLEDEELIEGNGFAPAPPAGGEEFNWEPYVLYDESLKFEFSFNAASGAHGLQVSTAGDDTSISLRMRLDDLAGTEGMADVEISSTTLGAFEVDLGLFAGPWQVLADDYPDLSEARRMKMLLIDQVDLLVDDLIAAQELDAQAVQQDAYPTLDLFGQDAAALWDSMPDGVRNWGLDWAPGWGGGLVQVEDSLGDARRLYFDRSNALYYTDDPVDPKWVVWMTDNTWELSPGYETYYGVGDDLINQWAPSAAPLNYTAPTDWPELNTGTGVNGADLAGILELRYG